MPGYSQYEHLIILMQGVLQQQQLLVKELNNMSSSIVTRDQFDAALTNMATSVSSALSELTTAISDLQAKVAAGQVVTPQDFSAELAQIQALTASATEAASIAVAADPTLAPPSTTATTPSSSGSSGTSTTTSGSSTTGA